MGSQGKCVLGFSSELRTLSSHILDTALNGLSDGWAGLRQQHTGQDVAKDSRENFGIGLGFGTAHLGLACPTDAPLHPEGGRLFWLTQAMAVQLQGIPFIIPAKPVHGVTSGRPFGFNC